MLEHIFFIALICKWLFKVWGKKKKKKEKNLSKAN